MTRLRVQILDLGKSLAAGAALGILTTSTMNLLPLDWWLESALAAALGATLLLVIPQWVVPTWTDPTGSLRRNLGKRLPSLLHSRWLD